jgi:hypothetical protein
MLLMMRKLRIAAVTVAAVVGLIAIGLGVAYYAAQQVQPFYVQALEIQPEALERGGRELESRATALYSDTKQVGRWQALFTAEQINGWLATQLAEFSGKELPPEIRDPRVAITPGVLTLGFRTKANGVDTVVSADSRVSLTKDGAVAIRLDSVRAGALPLPALQFADELASACQNLKLPIRWTRDAGKPVALVDLHELDSLYVDDVQLDDGQLYVAGHTEKIRKEPNMQRQFPPLSAEKPDADHGVEIR